VTCLFVSIAAAVAVGVLLASVLALGNAARDVRLVRIVAMGRAFTEVPVPPLLDKDNALVVLDVYGSLFFAGARSLEEQLPKIGDAERPVVVLRLRGHMRAGVTLIDVLDAYADALAAAGGRLYLSGLSPALQRQFEASLELNDGNDPELVPSQAALGAATRDAVRAACRWRRGSHSRAAQSAASP